MIETKVPKENFSRLAMLLNAISAKVYVHLIVDCTSLVKIIIINEALTVAPESESAIFSKIIPVINEFSIVFPATAAAVLIATAITTTRRFHSLALLSTPPVPPPLTIAPPFPLLLWPAVVLLLPLLFPYFCSQLWSPYPSSSTTDTILFLFYFIASLAYPHTRTH